MIKSVTIVGGYGIVGRNIARQLIQSTDLKVLIAGRNFLKAQTLSQQLGDRALPVEINIENQKNYEQISQIDLVIMCID